MVDDLDLADRLREAFAGRLWIEIVRPARDRGRERRLLEGARARDLPLIASTAAHLAEPGEYAAFRAGVAVQRGALLEQMPARLAITAAHHLIEPPAWPLRFPDLPDAVRNTDILAEKLQDDVLPRATILPRPRTPRGWSLELFLRRLCHIGGLARGGLDGERGTLPGAGSTAS